jgi:hypothetical protein
MKSIGFAIAAAGLLAAGTSFAQVRQGTDPAGTAPTRAPPGSSSNTGAASTGGAGTNRSAADANKDVAAASGNTNQAVATTNANAPAPAKGANSFTMGEAKSRIEKNGYSNVSDLAKDDNGVWRGTAQKGGSGTTVWLDYKGNVGTSK